MCFQGGFGHSRLVGGAVDGHTGDLLPRRRDEDLLCAGGPGLLRKQRKISHFRTPARTQRCLTDTGGECRAEPNKLVWWFWRKEEKQQLGCNPSAGKKHKAREASNRFPKPFSYYSIALQQMQQDDTMQSTNWLKRCRWSDRGLKYTNRTVAPVKKEEKLREEKQFSSLMPNSLSVISLSL